MTLCGYWMYANVSNNLLPTLLGYKMVEVAGYFEILVPVLSVYAASLTDDNVYRNLVCIPDSHPHKVTSAKCCIDTVISPDDGHSRPKRVEKNKQRKLVHEGGFIYKIIQGCTVDKTWNSHSSCILSVRYSVGNVRRFPCLIYSTKDTLIRHAKL